MMRSSALPRASHRTGDDHDPGSAPLGSALLRELPSPVDDDHEGVR
jgi:hypothetical protein